MLRSSLVAPRACIASCIGPRGSKHSVEVTADSLYEAVAQGLRAFRDGDWVDDIGRGHTISVVVRQPEIEHKVQLRDFERWLESQGRTPAEVSLKGRLRELLKCDSTSAGSVASGRSDLRSRDR